MRLMSISIVFVGGLLASVAIAQSSANKDIPSPVAKAENGLKQLKANAKSKESSKPASSYSGVFEFKGLVTGRTVSDVFSGKEPGRTIITDPSLHVLRGFMPIRTKKSTVSHDFVDYVCSKVIGAEYVRVYEADIKKRLWEGKKDFEEQMDEARRSRSLFGPDLSRAEFALNYVKRIAAEETEWYRAKKESDTAYGECVDTIANRRIETMHLSFYKELLGSILIVFDPKDFATVLAGLTEKYGQPQKSDKTQLHIKFSGAPSSFVVADWKDSKGNQLTLRSHEQDGSVYREQGILRISFPEFDIQFAKEIERSGVVPAAKDL